mmetsp:Transcript_26469/g.42539  ORF Transcript_26469/g.42539 Transcript_26469/m.42539 type:complete len:81 (+) Transcript_26469:1670-1912(+)
MGRSFNLVLVIITIIIAASVVAITGEVVTTTDLTLIREVQKDQLKIDKETALDIKTSTRTMNRTLHAPNNTQHRSSTGSA